MVRRSMSTLVGSDSAPSWDVRDRPDLRNRGRTRSRSCPNGMPSAPTSIAVCGLNWVATSPPRLAPSGTAPHEIIRYAALTRPRRPGTAVWRRPVACALAIPIPSPSGRTPSPGAPSRCSCRSSGRGRTEAELPATSVASSTRPYPKRPAMRAPNQAPTNLHRADRDREPDQRRAQSHVADDEDHQADEEDLEEQVVRRRLRRAAAAGTGCGWRRAVLRRPRASRARSAGRPALLHPDPDDRDRGHQIAGRVEQHGDRCGERLDEQAAEARPLISAADWRRRRLAVRVEQPLGRDHRGRNAKSATW